MRFRLLGLLLSIFLLVFEVHADEMPPQSGVIAMASEPVSVKTTPIKGKIVSRTANTGQAIYLNDEIKTSATSKAQILLKDQSVFSIGPNSTMVIDKFVYDPQKSTLNVAIQKGAFKFVSGKIANTSDEAMKVSLPNATIAVRGTGVAGIVEPNGSATVMLLHGKVDVTSMANNSASTLSKSGWGVQINPSGVVSPPAPLPADVTRNIMQTSKVTQAAPVTASSNSGSGTSSTTASTTSTLGSSIASSNSNAATTLAAPEAISIVYPAAASIATTASSATSVIQSVTTGSGVTPTSSSTTLAGSSSGTFSSTAATQALNLGNNQLTTANSYLATAQTESSNAVSQAASAANQATTAATQATTAATHAAAAANPPSPESAIQANELAAAAATLASSASTSANSYSSQAATRATNTSQTSTASVQSSNLAIGYAVTATQQSNSDTTLVGQAKTLSTQANATSASATLASIQAASAATSAQNSANQATTSSFAAANSALDAYQSALSIAKTLSPYETITQGIDISGVLKPLGSVTFSTTNIAMSCINGVNCGGANSSAIINSHSFTFNFLNSAVTNSYNISYNNFNGYTGAVSGVNTATAINWSSATVVSLPVTGQVSSSPVSAASDVLLTSVGTVNLTKRANLATVFTTISSPINGGGTAYMGSGSSGYKILGK